MRRISKTHPPQSFRSWLADNNELDCSYRAFCGTPAHKELKQKLLQEQGFLCAYTGLRIDEENSHIEHVKPQNRCADREDVDYRNMLACFPKNGGDISYGYGAPAKAGWWEEILFVSPLSEECERRFAFAWSGHVEPQPENYEPARKTIGVLNLDHDTLVRLRRSAINGFFGFSARAGALSKPDAQRLLATIDEVDASNKLRPFCFVLKHLLERYCA